MVQEEATLKKATGPGDWPYSLTVDFSIPELQIELGRRHIFSGSHTKPQGLLRVLPGRWAPKVTLAPDPSPEGQSDCGVILGHTLPGGA